MALCLTVGEWALSMAPRTCHTPVAATRAVRRAQVRHAIQNMPSVKDINFTGPHAVCIGPRYGQGAGLLQLVTLLNIRKESPWVQGRKVTVHKAAGILQEPAIFTCWCWCWLIFQIAFNLKVVINLVRNQQPPTFLVVLGFSSQTLFRFCCLVDQGRIFL